MTSSSASRGRLQRRRRYRPRWWWWWWWRWWCWSEINEAMENAEAFSDNPVDGDDDDVCKTVSDDSITTQSSCFPRQRLTNDVTSSRRFIQRKISHRWSTSLYVTTAVSRTAISTQHVCRFTNTLFSSSRHKVVSSATSWSVTWRSVHGAGDYATPWRLNYNRYGCW